MSISLRTFIEQIKTRPAIIWATFHFILLLIVRIITGFNGLYGQDSHAYFGHSQALHAWMQGGPTPGKFFWPEGFPFLGALFSYLFEPIFALQMISLLAASLSVYFFARLLQQLYPQVRHHAPFSFLLIGLSPLVFRGGLLIMAESQSLAFIIAGSYFILRYQFTTHKSAIFLAGLCIGAAIITRYPAALLLSLPTAWLGWFALKKRDYAGIFLLLAGLFLTLAPQFFWGNNHSNGLADHHFLSQWSVGNFFRQDFQMQDGAMHYRFINLAYVMGAYGHPFLVGLSGLLGLFLLLRSGASVWGRWAQVPVILYLLFIGGIPFQNTRFLILPLPFVMILVFGTLAAGKPFADKWEKWKPAIGLGFAAVSLVFALLLVNRFAVQSRLEKEIAEVVERYSPTNLYAFGMNQAVETYCPDQRMVSLWKEKIEVAEPGEYILFNEKRFAKQWAGKNPMLNWEFLQNNYHLREIHSFAGGWKLYEIR